MTCKQSCVHQIKISNLQNDEVVRHRLLLVKGLVVRLCNGSDEIKLRLTDSTNLVIHQQSTHVARSGEFKFLIDLQGYLELNVSFSYCNCKHSLRILHEISDNCYRIQPLYIICKGERGEYLTKQGSYGNADTACQLIDLNLLLVQSLYAEKLHESGFERQSFTLNGECQVFRSALTCEESWKSTENELWHAFGTEILNSNLGNVSKLKFVAFIACTKYNGAAVAAQKDFSYANIRRNLKAHAALGGGGLALFGSGYFYAWAQTFDTIISCLQDDSKVDLAKFPDDSNYRRTHAGVYATSLGAVCHELGHIFDLGHTQDGIMGSGFDYLNRVFTVDNLTEDLPKRMVLKSAAPVHQMNQGPLNIPKFTKIKKSGDGFMEKYHEQKSGDSFYFTRNCAVILAYHRWIKMRNKEELAVLDRGDDDELLFDIATQTVKSSKDALKLIEIRATSNGFVDLFYEFSHKVGVEAVFCFNLPPTAMKLEKSHYIFVITACGYTKSLNFY